MSKRERPPVESVESLRLKVAALEARVRELEPQDVMVREMADRSPNMIFINQRGRLVYVNQRCVELMGYSRDELLAPDFDYMTLVAPESRARVQAAGARHQVADHAERYELVALAKDGRRIDTLLTSWVGQYRGERATFGIQTDITERRRLEARANHAQRLESLGILAGGIAHDFNNLLVGVLGNASLALMDMPADAPARVAVQQIAFAARRAATLTNQMLAYSGRGTLARETMSLPEVVGEMLQLLQASIPKTTCIAHEVQGDVRSIRGDVTQMQQVVMNLVTNAAEAMADKGGVINVTIGGCEGAALPLFDFVVGETPVPGRYATLTVADSGLGMDPALLDRIFEPFFTTKFTGRGLGLAAVLGIVRGHRGVITVRTAPGRGSVFRVLIPASEERPPAPTRVTDVDAALTPDATTGLVRIADDEEIVRVVASRTLERAGFETLVVNDGLEAVNVVRARGDEIDVVILDYTMPNLSGADACRQIQKLKPDLPVILSSGYSAAEATERFAPLGLAAFLQKPYLPQEFVTMVRDVISERRSRA
ncbi:MAG: response regulator [Deltaproteobacteria bacterium]|nr:response regulator [Deltaproteobacteria bacterium]